MTLEIMKALIDAFEFAHDKKPALIEIDRHTYTALRIDAIKQGYDCFPGGIAFALYGIPVKIIDTYEKIVIKLT